MDQKELILSLVHRGWFSAESFLDPLLCKKLLIDLHSLPLRKAKIGKGSSEQLMANIRNDSIFWLDEKNESPAQNEYLEEMNNLMMILNRELFLGLKQFEGHFAKYEKNGFYKKHIDQHQGHNQRLISVITYLNTPDSGGELRIFKKDNSEEIEVDIPPKAGSLVCFLSNQIYHEVRPTMSERYSVTGWLRTTIL